MDAQQVSTVPNQPRLSGGAIWTQDQSPAKISACPSMVNAIAITLLNLDIETIKCLNFSFEVISFCFFCLHCILFSPFTIYDFSAIL